MDQVKIGKFIAALRKEQGMTQEALGEKLCVTNKTISRWETGSYMPDIDKLLELSSLLGISVNELLTGERLAGGQEFAQKADENLIEALSKSVFGVQDRVKYFKKKWRRDHWGLITISVLICLFLWVVGFWKQDALVFGIAAFVTIALRVYTCNNMMTYVEHKVYD